MQKFGHELRRQRAVLAPDRFDKIVALATLHAGERMKPSIVARGHVAIDLAPENFANPDLLVYPFSLIKIITEKCCSNDLPSFSGKDV